MHKAYWTRASELGSSLTCDNTLLIEEIIKLK